MDTAFRTVSHAQTQMRCLYELSTRSTRRGYRPPVNWAKAISRWRLHRSTIVTMMWGETITGSLGQSRNALLQKTTLSSRHKKWQQGLTSCSTSLKLLAPKFVPESQRQRLTAGKGLGLVLETISHSLLQVLQKGDSQGYDGSPRSTYKWCLLALKHVHWVGLKLFCPWCFKLGGNTKTIAIHLTEIHYLLAIACDICQLFLVC